MNRKVLIVLPLLLAMCGCREKVERELVYLRNGGEGEKRVVEPQLRVFERQNPGVRVKLVMVPWGQGEQKLIAMILSGNPPDLAYVGSRQIPTLVKLGALLPIKIPERRRQEYFNIVWDMVKWNGKIYGIPRAFSTKVLYYNRDLFDKAGVGGPPRNWDELLSACDLMKRNTDSYGFALAGAKFVSTTTQFLNFLFQNGGEVLGREGEVRINDEKAAKALQFYDKLKEYSQPGPVAHKREDLSHVFREGKIGMYVSGPWRRAVFEKAGTPFGMAPLPAGPGGQSSCTLVSDAIVAFKASKEPDLSRKLLLFLTNRENQTSLDTTWGLVPMRVEEAQLPYFQAPSWRPFIDMIPTGRPQPLVPNWRRFEDALTDAIQEVLSEEKTPEEALDRVAEVLAEEG